ncbi:MAG: hypothetical protein IPL59_04590 [Candidatus Competibacteraceae bacterium]|nr:hypothetical protein [Candidatus Competibacteraceae bacterium]
MQTLEQQISRPHESVKSVGATPRSTAYGKTAKRWQTQQPMSAICGGHAFDSGGYRRIDLDYAKRPASQRVRTASMMISPFPM